MKLNADKKLYYTHIFRQTHLLYIGICLIVIPDFVFFRQRNLPQRIHPEINQLNKSQLISKY